MRCVNWLPVTCPTCFETFEIPAPDRQEAGSQIDYDCEVCCRPMVLTIVEEAPGELSAHAASLDDLS